MEGHSLVFPRKVDLRRRDIRKSPAFYRVESIAQVPLYLSAQAQIAQAGPRNEKFPARPMPENVVIATMFGKSFSNVALTDSDDAITAAPDDVDTDITRIGEIESFQRAEVAILAASDPIQDHKAAVSSNGIGGDCSRL
ncbi:MAG: hypothetical protein OXT64_13310 [Gammaproteobacteria bacterium]|nr:hypothetical protein [Gammaproteobacteria bacterium]